jgi:phage-related minor tail protein
MILESLIVPLLADIDNFTKGLSKAQTKADQTSKSLSEKFKSVGEGMMKTGGLVSLGLTTPIVAFGTASLNAASDLNETVSKVGVVFGDQSSRVMEFGKTSATALGMSENAALSAVGTYGNLFVSMNMSTDKAADMSMGLVTLAADLASFNNMDSTEVLDKLRAGLTGETEPLKALGVNLNAAMVEAKALEMGLLGVDGELSASAKAQATYALVLDQTKTAQGDFARTSDGLANSTRIAKAEFENISAQLGQSLLPIATDLMKALIPLLNWFNDLDPSVKNNIVVIGGLIAAIGPAITTIGGLSSSVGSLIGLFGAGGGLAGVGTFLSGTVLPGIGMAIGAVGLPVIALGLAIGALIAVIIVFGEDAQNTLNMVKGIFDGTMMVIGWWLKDTFIGIWNNVSNAIAGVVGWVSTLANSFNSLSIPSWLMPGSPPPLFYALKDVEKQMKGMVSGSLSDFNSELSIKSASSALPTKNIQNTNSSNADIVSAISALKVGYDEERLVRLLVSRLAKAGI